MLYGIEKINDVIEYIESNLASPHSAQALSCEKLAAIAGLSSYEFRRIFSFIVGVPVAEYIRRRKMSLAAGELKSTDLTVAQIGAKYGYDSASSFSRAFRDIYGITPLKAQSTDEVLSVYTKPCFELHISGGEAIDCRIKKLDAFTVSGLTGTSPITDTCCCESVWHEFENGNAANTVENLPEFNGSYAAAYKNGIEDVECTVGAITERNVDGLDNTSVEPSLWACFNASGSMSEREICGLYNKIIYSWEPSSCYVRNSELPNIEYFPQNENGDFEIYIPIKLREE